jgi:hypothetical protein
MANEVKKTLDESGLLYFGQQYYAKLRTRFVAIEEGKALSTNDFTTADKQKLDNIEAEADVNVIETVKVNGTALTPNSDKAVDVTVVEGTNNGTVKVNGTDISVHGLGSAAFTESSAYDAAGAAAAVLGAATDQSSANTVYGVKAALNEALGNGGSVATQISTAISALDATQGADASGADSELYVVSGVDITQADGVITGVSVDSVAVDPAGAAAAAQTAAEAYADSLASNYDAAGSAANVLGTSSDTAANMTVYGVKAALDDALGNGGSVSSQITTAINALDSTDTAVENQFVTSVSEADGIITVTRARPSAANISVTALDNIAAGDLQTVLGALEDAIDAGGTGSVVTVEKQSTAESGYAATYIVKQGNAQVGVKINIPKDFLVKSASVETVATADTPYSGAAVGDKYIDFVVNTTDASETAQHIYLPVNELVDVYTAGNGIDISNANVVSAVIDNTSESFLTVGANGLKLSGVQTAIDNGRDAAKTYADGLIAALDADLDASGTAAHSGTFVVSGVTEANGVITGVDSVEVEAAGAAAAVQSTLEAAIAALDADLDASGTAQHAGTFVVSGVTQVDGEITAVDSVEVEAAGAAAAAEAAAKSYADGKAATAEQNAKDYADTKAAAVAVTADVASNSTSYVTASASGKNVTVGLTSDAISYLVAGSTAIQSLSKVDGNYVTLAISADGTARTITVTDSLIGTALAGKADKVGNATAGNLAALDSNGNLTDAGISVAGLQVTYMTNQEIQDIVDDCFPSA